MRHSSICFDKVAMSIFANSVSIPFLAFERVCFVCSRLAIVVSVFLFSSSSLALSFVKVSILIRNASLSSVTLALEYRFEIKDGFISELNFSLASASFSSIGSKPIHLESNLPLSASFFFTSSSRVVSLIDIIKSKSLSLPIASLMTLFV